MMLSIWDSLYPDGSATGAIVPGMMPAPGENFTMKKVNTTEMPMVCKRERSVSTGTFKSRACDLKHLWCLSQYPAVQI
jgi:hypothetical protein